MQRLVKVADEMHHELQRFNPLLACLRRVRQHPRLPLEGVDDVLAFAAVAFRVKARRVVREVDVVPVGGVATLAANLVGPTRDFRVGDTPLVKKFAYRHLRLRRQLVFGDQGNQLVALAAPRGAN